MRKITTTLAATAAGLMLAAVPFMAAAADEAPTDEAAIVAPVTDEPTATEPEPAAPAEEEPVAPEVEAPAEEAPVETVPEVTPPVEPETETPAPVTTEVYWSLPNGGTPDNVTWPQPLAGPDALACGVWYQVDTYDLTDVPNLTADGKLDAGEDASVVISWRFVFGGDCPVIAPKPEPIVQEASSEHVDCEADVITTSHTVTTTDFALDESTGAWYPLEPVTTAGPNDGATLPAGTDACPVEETTPPVTPTPEVETPVVDSESASSARTADVADEDGLAITGPEDAKPLVAFMLLSVALGILALVAAKVAHRRDA